MSWLGGLFEMRSHRREGDLLPAEKAVTPEARARQIAEEEANRQGLAWRHQVDAALIWHRGRACWIVKSNANGLGFSATITIDDTTSAVVDTSVQRR